MQSSSSLPAHQYIRVLRNCQDTARATDDREVLYQVSTIDALMQGVFDGVQPVGEIRKHGDFGIGTFDALDGEMIVLDGVVYQAKADGQIYTASRQPDNPVCNGDVFRSRPYRHH